MDTIKNIMVCVTQQKTCKRLIKKGVKIRDKYDGNLFVIHVAKEGSRFLNKKEDGDALEFLFDVAKSHGASLTVVRAQDVLGTLKDLAVKNEIDVIIMGESYESKGNTNMVDNLEEILPDNIKIEMVPVDK